MTALRRRLFEDMQVRNLSPHTQVAYIQQVSRFVRHFGRSPDALGPEEIRERGTIRGSKTEIPVDTSCQPPSRPRCQRGPLAPALRAQRQGDGR